MHDYIVRPKVSIFIGFIVILVFIYFFTLYNNTNVNLQYNTYYVSLKKSSGIKIKQNININGGIEIGKVESIFLDSNNKPKMKVKINKNIKLPIDSVIDITSASLFAMSTNINVVLGIEDTYLEDNNNIDLNVSNVDITSLLDLISQYVKKAS